MRIYPFIGKIFAISYVYLKISKRFFSFFRNEYKFCSNVVCLPLDYNKMTMPPRESGSDPVVIEISMFLLDILNIDHHDFSISISIFFGLSWQDNRIKVLGNKSSVNLDIDFINKIWVWLRNIHNFY